VHPNTEVERRPGAPSRDAEAFFRYAARVKVGLDRALAEYLANARDAARALPPSVQVTIDAIQDLCMRGGKRLRAVLLAASYEACGGGGGPEAVVLGGVSLELLQAYLLIHDDWMDGDDVRRGGPSVPAMLRRHFAGAPTATVADAFTILAGDYAAGLALSALSEVPVARERLAFAGRELGRIQRDVVLGQMCDLDGELRREPPTLTAVELTHKWKTGSYTVRGPLVLGAHLAGAAPSLVTSLEAFADPLGVAFQLRDDVLGTFGDPDRTGKPSTSDLRQGKRTALVAALVSGGSPEASALLSRVLGKPDASASDLAALVDVLVSSGAKRTVEARIDELVAEAMRALDALPIHEEARALLRGAADALGHRES
jgi:geranylgeranyl diphosphate synthase type I